MREKIKPTDKIPLELTPYERKLIINETLADDDLLKQVRLAQIKGKNIVSMFTFSELDDLAGHVAFSANHAKTPKLQKKLDRIIDKIDTLIARYTDEEAHFPMGATMPPDGEKPSDAIHGDDLFQNPANEFQRFLAESFEGKTFNNLEEMNKLLTVKNSEYNDAPQSEMGGLSPTQVSALLHTGWDTDKSAIKLNGSFSFEDVKDAPIFKNAKIFLDTLVREGGVKATATGNLNRKFVKEMMGSMRWPEKYIENFWSVNKVANEVDVFLLHIVRIILQESRLIRKVKGVFKITRKGESLLPEEKSGSLYLLLFKTHFLGFNLAYLDGLPELNSFQSTIAFTFYMFGKLGLKWKGPKELAPLLLLPVVKDEVPIYDTRDSSHILIETRFINPMESFGLLEKRYLSEKKYFFSDFEVRKTKLFDSFFSFDLGKES